MGQCGQEFKLRSISHLKIQFETRAPLKHASEVNVNSHIFLKTEKFLLKTDIISLLRAGQSLSFFQSSLAPLRHDEVAVSSDFMT